MNRIFKIIGALIAALFLAAVIFYLVIAVEIGHVPQDHEIPFHLSAYAAYGFLIFGFIAFVRGKKRAAQMGYILPIIICAGFIVYDMLK